MNKTYVLGAIVVIVLIGGIFLALSSRDANVSGEMDTPLMTTDTYKEKVYVALEGEGKVAVIDTKSTKVIATIDLSETGDGEIVRYMAHNVQVTPDGKKVLVTANVEEGMEMEDGEMPHGDDMGHGQKYDKLIVIDPMTDKVIDSISVDTDSHLAHVVTSPDARIAYVASQEKSKVYLINIENGEVMREVVIGEASGPHGLRVSPDGSEVYIALIDGKAMAILDTKTNNVRNIALPGAGVQTAVTPDGMYAFSSVYDTKQIAWLNRGSNEQGLISLPEGSRGPVQIYSTPDSRYLYVADQGYYFDQPTGNLVYRIDIRRKAVDQTITAGSAPHGIVVSKDGTRAYVTNLLGDDVSIIDTTTNTEIMKIPVGDMPNGISIWNGRNKIIN